MYIGTCFCILYNTVHVMILLGLCVDFSCSLLVHSEANHRRIAIVEQCFGSNGQVSTYMYITSSCKFIQVHVLLHCIFCMLSLHSL